MIKTIRINEKQNSFDKKVFQDNQLKFYPEIGKETINIKEIVMIEKLKSFWTNIKS